MNKMTYVVYDFEIFVVINRSSSFKTRFGFAHLSVLVPTLILYLRVTHDGVIGNMTW